MENFDNEIKMLDEMINENEKKLKMISGKINNLSYQILYIVLEQMSYIKNILSDNKFKDGVNLTFLKKIFYFFKKISFFGVLSMIVAFFFNPGILFVLLTVFMAIIAYVCKDKYIEYAGMISRYEVAIRQYYHDECKIDLSLVRRKKQEVQDKINNLEGERDLLNEEFLMIQKINEKIIKNKIRLLHNRDIEDVIDLAEDLVEQQDNLSEEKGNILVKKLNIN